MATTTKCKESSLPAFANTFIAVTLSKGDKNYPLPSRSRLWTPERFLVCCALSKDTCTCRGVPPPTSLLSYRALQQVGQ
jgi:hypothetical protein